MAYVTDLKHGGGAAWTVFRDAAVRALTAIWTAIKTSQERRAQRILAEHERNFWI